MIGPEIPPEATILRGVHPSGSDWAHEVQGVEHDIATSIIVIDAPPGDGPDLHWHPYSEVIVVVDGEMTLTAGGRIVTLGAGDVAIAPAGLVHGFKNSGDGPLRSLDIHLAGRFDTSWVAS